MAAIDSVVVLAAETLTNLIVREANLLIGVKEKVEWIEAEFQFMVAHLQSIDALHQIPGNVNDCIEETRLIIRRTENVIETYAKRVALSKMAAPHKRFFYWFEKNYLARDLEKIKDEILRVRKRWKSVDFENQDLPTPSSVSSRSAGICKLDDILQSTDEYFLNGTVLMRIISVRDELVHLYNFLQEIETDRESLELILSERHKVWIQELRNIDQSVDESIASLESYSFLLSCTGLKSEKFGDTISEIQNKIFQLYRRYFEYGVGEIQVNNDGASCRPIFPRIRMDRALISYVPEERGMAFRPLISSPTITGMLLGIPSIIVDLCLPLPKTRGIETIEVDMKLMNALLEDTKSMRYLDGRVKVWLEQMQKIFNDLDKLIEYSRDVSEGKKGLLGHIFGPSKIANKLGQIRHEMYDITARKLRYGVDIAMGETGESLYLTSVRDSFKYPQQQLINYLESFISKNEFGRQIQSVKLELQLMQAILKDAEGMEKLDARLKVWVEEMRDIEFEAKAILEHNSANPYERFRAARRIDKLKNHISVMSKWKRTYDIVDVRKTKISNFVNHELREIEGYPSTDVEQEFELIRRELRFMEAFDSDIRDMDGPAKVWVESMRDIAEDAQKLISSYDIDGTKLSWNWKYKSVNGFIIPVRIRDVDRINDRIAQLSETRMDYGIELRKRLPPNIVSELKAKLLERPEDSCVIPVIGMSDIQYKEALKEFLHNEKAITDCFGYYTWVCVSREVSQTSTMQLPENVLWDKRLLLVLDELQPVEIRQYLELVFQRTSSTVSEIPGGSRIILLTNERTVTDLTQCSGSDSTHSLFTSNSDDVSDSIGLRLLDSFKLAETRDENTDEPRVPSYLKQCLYYFLLFPANIKVVPVRRLIVLWIAEGLVRPRKVRNEPVERTAEVRPRKDDNESLERTAENYLNKLIELNMVKATKKKNGKLKACQLCDGMRDKWLKKAKDARFIPVDTNDKITRLVDYHGGKEPYFIKIDGNSTSTSLQKYKDALSFLSFDSREGSKPGEDIGNFLHKCIAAQCFEWLRVLDLERVFRPKLPKQIALLTGLRYLGLRWTYLENLPTGVIGLLNLQVLDVKHTYISTLPRSIWSMQYLRHLYLSETFRTRFVGQPSKVSLTDLQTLWGAFVDENTAVEQGLDTLLNIRKLGLTCRSSTSEIVQQLKAVDKWIANLEFLESLRLKSRDESGNPSDLHLNPLTRHLKLSTVYLLGKLQPNVVSEFPKNLTEITLSGSELSEDPMKSLGKLQNLSILRLLAKSVVCGEMHCSSESFPRLKFLCLWKLKLLEKWEVEEGALPSLEDLDIRSCKNLIMLPEALKMTVTLKSVKLTKMPEKFMEYIKDKQIDIWRKIESVKTYST